MHRLAQAYADTVDFEQFNIDDPISDQAKRNYHFVAQPQVVILDRQGHIVATRHSGLTYLGLQALLEQALQ